MLRHRRFAATAAALTLGAVATAVFGFVAPASAHVTVNPREATQGGYGRLAFRVPNESDTASTTKLEIFLPENAPVGSVSTMPVPGWSVAVEKRQVDPPVQVHGSEITEVVSKITWTAGDGAAIAPGTFQEFPVSMGPLPETDQMVFKALQTYSDGAVVRWIDEPQPGGEEPAAPAPVLTLTAASAADTPTEAPADSPAGAQSDDSDDEDGNGLAVGLGVAGLLAGLGGLVLGGLAFARTRRSSGTAATPAP
ncbi:MULTISPECIES: YcnI family protein [Micromonospora]|uniref:YcnI family protein n=1 Tax=Verrucosispora sioxanthis TaxID=2499994 RepID=A0A6M1KTJ9_9ACTN|nr:MULTISPECIES: YcnI family protein [Micromonospora]MCZ7420599.1 YcnI family protein [Verrucosispora sp. WMMA2121]NEE62936.1 YcnI family protein [Verrucosispora sioxanthis]NGM12046.1 YcnI family protein [Verrucosispora sioxanthis]WBB88941.1 YcnI family protein [Verrucosispora sp. WMMC514]